MAGAQRHNVAGMRLTTVRRQSTSSSLSKKGLVKCSEDVEVGRHNVFKDRLDGLVSCVERLVQILQTSQQST